MVASATAQVVNVANEHNILCLWRGGQFEHGILAVTQLVMRIGRQATQWLKRF